MRRGITRNVVALGVVSFLTDVSTEMILPVLPLFVTGVLGGTAVSVGLIEGVAESVSSLLRIVSGWLSDKLGARKPFLLFGYGVSGVAKAALALAASWPAVLGLRAADRVGKGLRNPPRDALIADSVEPAYYGAAFGFHRALDTLGAALGPLAAFAILAAAPGHYGRVFLWSAVPAALSLVVLAVFVRSATRERARSRPSARAALAELGRPLKSFLIVAGLFSLANSSIAFLILRAQGVGVPASRVPLIYFAYNLVYALLSYPIGHWTDSRGRRPALLAAYASFAVLYGVLAATATPAWTIAVFVLLGVHSALLEGSQRAYVADLVPPDRRASAYGLYYTVVGLALLPASAVAGWLWERAGPQFTFALEAGLAALAALWFALARPPGSGDEEFRARAA
jgi:MFS family permease